MGPNAVLTVKIPPAAAAPRPLISMLAASENIKGTIIMKSVASQNAAKPSTSTLLINIARMMNKVCKQVVINSVFSSPSRFDSGAADKPPTIPAICASATIRPVSAALA